ncbi:MAG: phage holin family protein [Chthoniobacteraceae bacterium]
MPGTEPSHDIGTAGVVGRARKFLAACAQYASARLRLASIEGREAAAHGFKLLMIVGAAIVFGAFGWLFACLAAVFLLAKAFGGANGWVWAALIMAGLHFAGVLALALVLKSKLGTTLFPMTAEELKKDQEWLDQQNTTNTQS